MSGRTIRDLTEEELEEQLDRHIAGANACLKEQRRRFREKKSKMQSDVVTPSLDGTATQTH